MAIVQDWNDIENLTIADRRLRYGIESRGPFNQIVDRRLALRHATVDKMNCGDLAGQQAISVAQDDPSSGPLCEIHVCQFSGRREIADATGCADRGHATGAGRGADASRFGNAQPCG